MKTIARIQSDFKEKFGIPRQSGLVEELEAVIVFEPEYRDPAALRGLEGFSHLWLIWLFSESVREGWSPTVRPPRLGGNERIGVFATRSPFRPNEIGLSSVKLLGIEQHKELGPVLRVAGADLLDGTPILDIKPYLPHVDSHPDARSGFVEEHQTSRLEVVFPEKLLQKVPKEKRKALQGVLAEDPRPSYHNDETRIYGMNFAGYEIKFRVKDTVLEVCEVEYQTLRHEFLPVWNEESEVLILGSFPSVKSREQGFFYGHPRNRFWDVISTIVESKKPVTIEEKKKMLLTHHIAIWDVIESCRIRGSSDSSIRDVIPNDISGLLKKSRITKIFANGKTAEQLYNKYLYERTQIPITVLPSTSPANAAWSLERLVEEYRKIWR